MRVCGCAGVSFDLVSKFWDIRVKCELFSVKKRSNPLIHKGNINPN